MNIPYDNGLITTAAYVRRNQNARELTRAVARGDLVKLRRGVYADGAVWNAADERARHILRARAAITQMEHPPVLAGFTAAAVWGMPVEAFPATVSFAESWKGGGRSAPGVRRTAAAYPSTEVVSRDGFHVTTLARTALELTRSEPFAQAVASMDWVLWRKNPIRISRDELVGDLARVTRRFGVERARVCVEFATHLSDSYGESLCRGLMHEFGFQRPTLQLELHDWMGRMVPDFAWERERILLEFDGKGKYLRSMKPGESPGDVVWREKRREDRLRALGWTVIRAVWSDLMRPERWVRALVEAGVPRSLR